MTDYDALRRIATFCGECSCGCPQLFVNDTAIPERRITITDDFGQRIEMSTDQLRDLVAEIRAGVLDTLLTPATA